MFGDVIVPLDGGAEAARALGPARKIAEYLESPLRIVAYHELGSDGVDLEQQVLSNLTSLDGADFTLSVEAIEGSVAAALGLELEAHPSALVVMSTHGRGRSAAFIGSVANDLLHVATGPVLLVGPKANLNVFRLEGPMIVAVEESEHAVSVLPIAESFSIVFGYTPEVVEVLTPEELEDLQGAQVAGLSGDFPLESAGVQRAAAAVKQAIGRDVNYEILHDKNPAKALAEYAKFRNAPLIAMATHAPAGMSRLSHGSVTADTVADAPCPVLAVRPPDFIEG